ncbi:response regulator transcription factor [Streptomyces antimycoticus]|uniref:response regulator transcription factor n=1 Tax=Streptomyces antimycoticus TaxID=68175 RepID=UPI0036B3BF92
MLRLVAQGRTNAEIGRRLFIGESTVKTHLLRAFGKLGVADRTAAVPARCGWGCCRGRERGPGNPRAPLRASLRRGASGLPRPPRPGEPAPARRTPCP